MIDLEQEVREVFAARTASPPPAATLTDRVVAQASAVRRRRVTAIAMTAIVAVVVVVSATLLRIPHDGTAATPADPPVGQPPALAVFGTASLHQPDGVELSISVADDGTVREVHRAAGGWVVLSQDPVGTWATAAVVRDDTSVVRLSTMSVAMALAPTGDRVAVQSRLSHDEDRIEVFEVPTGEVTATTALPSMTPAGELRVNGWSGSLVLLSASSQRGAVSAADVWDPGKGAYRPSPVEDRLLIGPADQPGQALAVQPGREPDELCLLRVEPAAGFAIKTRSCGLGLVTGVWLRVSPDRRWVAAWQPDQADSHLSVIDVAAALSRTVELPGGVVPEAVWWEDSGTVLIDGFEPRLQLLRCHVDTSSCELAPVPAVDGGPAQGVVQEPAG